jgi:hypothetical protein
VSAVDTLADKAEGLSRRLSGESGFKGKLAKELADDAVFLRKLKPSLMKKRARGEAPTDEKPARPKLDGQPSAKSGGGPSPFVVVGVAFVAGVILARWIDWRGHAHPRW